MVPLPQPRPIGTRPVKWTVLTPDNLPSGDFVLFALTPPNYEALSLNQAETLRWVLEAKHRLDYYNHELQGTQP